MRAACIFAALLLLTACQRERTFDERFAEASSKLDAKAGSIDRELTISASEAALVSAEPEASEAP